MKPATEGGIPMSLLPVNPVPRGQKVASGGSDGEGERKGTFQGEQRPTETDPSQDNNGG